MVNVLWTLKLGRRKREHLIRTFQLSGRSTLPVHMIYGNDFEARGLVAYSRYFHLPKIVTRMFETSLTSSPAL
jgi:hypothetical protein